MKKHNCSEQVGAVKVLDSSKMTYIRETIWGSEFRLLYGPFLGTSVICRVKKYSSSDFYDMMLLFNVGEMFSIMK